MVRVRQQMFLFSKASKQATAPTQRPVQYVTGQGVLIRRPEHEADHSLPSSAEVYNESSYTSTAQCTIFRAKGQLYSQLTTMQSDKMLLQGISESYTPLANHTTAYRSQSLVTLSPLCDPILIAHSACMWQS
jgi:hypothetical protein